MNELLSTRWPLKRTVRGLAFALALAGIATPARADEATPDAAVEARNQYQMGAQAFSQKRYSEAALHFETATSLKASAIALYTAALAWDLAARPERAADAYARALDVEGLDVKQRNIAQERVSALEKSLGTLTVTAPEGWKVQLDTFTEVSTPARLHGTPGVHTLAVRAPSKPIERRDVMFEAGESETLELEEPPPVAPEAAPEPAPSAAVAPSITRVREPFWNTLRAVGVGVTGFGVAALGAGVVLGVNANGAKRAYDASPTRSAFDHASSLETWTNVTLISGALLAAGGVVLVVLPIDTHRSDRHLTVGAAPGGLTLEGIF